MTPPGPSDPTPPGGARLRRRLAIPELHTLRELRLALARGGMPPVAVRAPEDDARIAGFRTIQELLGLYEEFRRRVEDGEPCRLIERKHPREPNRLVIEWVIEAQP